jgi:hypothetical protein
MRAVAVAVAAAVCGCNYMRHPTETTAWGPPGGTMRLGLEGRGDVINVFLQNRAAHPQRIVSRGFTLTIAPPAGATGASEATRIVDAANIPLDREDSFETLKPGESLATPISVSRLRPGTYTVTASYRVEATGDWWTGALTAGPISFTRQ